MNMPRPSMLWIYGLIGAFIIGWYVFGDVNDTPLPSDGRWSKRATWRKFRS